MSILAASLPSSPTPAPTTLPAAVEVSPVVLGLLLLGCGVVIAAAIGTGVFRPRKVEGPDRILPGRGAWAMALVMAGSMFCSLVLSALYASYRLRQILGSADTRKFDLALLSTGDLALLATVPSILAFGALVFADSSISHDLLDRLGVRGGRFQTAFRPAFISLAFVIPLMTAVTILVEQLYLLVKYAHPTEHPLLHALGASGNYAVRSLLIVGAVVVAPLFEEFIFRGHLQSLLRTLLARLGLRRPNPDAFQTPVTDSIPSGRVMEYESPPAPSEWEPSVAASWGAILLTSVAFSLVHEQWTWPVIFVLAICLGYAYERTQNLWVPVFIHAGFNAASTIAFLVMSR